MCSIVQRTMNAPSLDCHSSHHLAVYCVFSLFLVSPSPNRPPYSPVRTRPAPALFYPFCVAEKKVQRRLYSLLIMFTRSTLGFSLFGVTGVGDSLTTSFAGDPGVFVGVFAAFLETFGRPSRMLRFGGRSCNGDLSCSCCMNSGGGCVSALRVRP